MKEIGISHLKKNSTSVNSLSLFLEEAYVEFSSFFNSSFDFRIGRQPLSLGKHIVLSDSSRNWGATRNNYTYNNGILEGQSYTNPHQPLAHSFDALSFKLSQNNNLSLSGFWAIPQSSSPLHTFNENRNLFSLSFHYKNDMFLKSELYYLYDRYANGNPDEFVDPTYETNQHYLGLMLSIPLGSQLLFSGEATYLSGEKNSIDVSIPTYIEAWSFNADLTYTPSSYGSPFYYF